VSEESEMDDDRLLHEVVWSAEAVLRAMDSSDPRLPVFACGLESWCKGVREIWAKRDKGA
jgi:hypothetical protein